MNKDVTWEETAALWSGIFWKTMLFSILIGMVFGAINMGFNVFFGWGFESLILLFAINVIILFFSGLLATKQVLENGVSEYEIGLIKKI